MSNKTLGKVSTNLIQTLYEKDKVIFNIKDTQAIKMSARQQIY